MHFSERFGQRQAKTGAFKATGELAFDLAEGRQRARNILRRDTDAGVAHGDPTAHYRIPRDRERDGAARRRELHGIAEQIDHNLFQPRFIRLQARQVLLQIEHDRDLILLGPRRHDAHASL